MSKATAQALQNKLLLIAEYGFTLELAMDSSKEFLDPKGDVQFFESVLKQIDLSHVGLIKLGGDLQPSRGDRHEEWIKYVSAHFSNHPSAKLS